MAAVIPGGVVGIGSLNLDLIYEVDELEEVCRRLGLAPGRERSCGRDELDRLVAMMEAEGRRVACSGGGSAANTVAAMARLGWRCGFLGAVGRDREGELVASSMEGVDLRCVARQGRTAVCLVILGRDQRDRAMVVAPAQGWLPALDQGCLDRARSAELLHLSSFVTQEGLRFQEEVVAGAQPGQVVSMDPGEIYAALPRARLAPLLARVDILLVTARELEMLFGPAAAGVEEAMATLHRRSRHPLAPILPMVVVKDGAREARCHWRGGSAAAAPEEAAHVVDTTGAGDAFDAGFLHGLLRGKSPRQALERGHRVARLSLTAYGRGWLEGLEGSLI